MRLGTSRSVLRWKNGSLCSSPTAPQGGITLTTRVCGSQHYILQQLQAGASSSSPVQTLASTQESNGTASSSSVSSPQLPHSAIRSQVLAVPTRNVTGDVMSATLAEAATQFSFAKFLERCNLLRSHPPRLQPDPTLLLDAPSQTFPHSAASAEAPARGVLSLMHQPGRSLDCSVPQPAHGKTCPTCSRPITTLLLDAAAQTPSHSIAPADATTQLPLTEFFVGCIYPMHRSVPRPTQGNAISASLLQPVDIAAMYSGSSTSRTNDRHVCTTAPRARLQCAPSPPPGLEDRTHLSSIHGIPVKAVPVRPRLHTSTPVQSCSHL